MKCVARSGIVAGVVSLGLFALAMITVEVRNFRASVDVSSSLPNEAMVTWQGIRLPLLRYTIEKNEGDGWRLIGETSGESFVDPSPKGVSRYKVKVSRIESLEASFATPPDRDQDGLFDSFETSSGTKTSPLLFSSGNSRAPDGFFVRFGLDTSTGKEDTDGDGENNESEFLAGTNPLIHEKKVADKAPDPAKNLKLETTDQGDVLTWTNPPEGVRGVIIERTSDGSNWITVGHSTGETFTDYTAEAKRVYFYRVAAHN